MNPLISFVIYTRNDSYMGNSNSRLETSLNYSANMLQNLNKLNQAEFVIVDWGSEIPLHKVLNLNEQAKQISRFLLVPPNFPSEICTEIDFPTSIILNAGIRRSKGDFIAQSASDILLTEKMLTSLFEIVERYYNLKISDRKRLYLFRRKHIPFEVAIGLCSSDKMFHLEVEKFPVEPLIPYLFGCSGTIMMHRELWIESHAFDEKLIHWGWNDIDLVLRMRLKYASIDMGEENHVYHIEHSMNNVSFINKRKVSPRVINPFIVNDENWGLSKFRFEEFPSNSNIEILDGTKEMSQNTDENYLHKHLINLVIFMIHNFTIKNFKFNINFALLILSNYPKGSILQKLYNFLMYIKQIIIRTKSEK